MTQRERNCYIGARAGLARGGSVQVCPERDEATAEVRAALERDGVPVRMQDGFLWVGLGPVAPEPVPGWIADAEVAQTEARIEYLERRIEELGG